MRQLIDDLSEKTQKNVNTVLGPNDVIADWIRTVGQVEKRQMNKVMSYARESQKNYVIGILVSVFNYTTFI